MNAQFVMKSVIKPSFSIHVDMPHFVRVVPYVCLKRRIDDVRTVEPLSEIHLECINKTVIELIVNFDEKYALVLDILQ